MEAWLRAIAGTKGGRALVRSASAPYADPVVRTKSLLLALALAVPEVAEAQMRLVQVRYTPTARAQIAIWIERADGTYLRALRLTEAVGLRGIGNRPGALQMNSGFRWPYGRREGVLPFWSHRRGDAAGASLFPLVRFQNRLSEGRASQTSVDQSRDDYFCLSFDKNAATNVDAVSCASVFNSDKGRFMTADDAADGYSEPFDPAPGVHASRALPRESYYPPRRDLTRRGDYDHPDMLLFADVARAVMPEIDAVTRATSPADATQALYFVVPPEWPEGNYVLYVEVNTERDHNTVYSAAAYPTPTNKVPEMGTNWFVEWDSWAMDYGYPYRGQPSVVYAVPIRLDLAGGTYGTETPVGYGDLHGFDGELRPMDATITDDPVVRPGSGADRLRRMTGVGRVGVVVERCENPPPVPSIASLDAAPVDDEKHSHEWAHLGFDSIFVGIGNALGYQVKISTSPIETAEDFERAVDAKSTSLEFEGIELCPFDSVNGIPDCPAGGRRVEFDIGKLTFNTRYYAAVRAVGTCGALGPVTSTSFETTPIHFETMAPCFVATAAHGSPLAADVSALRAFRDETLVHAPLGRAFITAYYTIGPALAARVAEHDALRAIARVVLEPFVAAVSR